MMFFQIAIIAVIVIGIGALFRTLVQSASKKINAQFFILAERFGLEITEHDPRMWGFICPEPSLFGSYRARELSISVPGKGLQNTRQIETVLKVELRKKDLSAQMGLAGVLSGLRQRDSGGKPRWHSGNAVFDAVVDVRTNTASALEPLLTDKRRNWMVDHLKAGKGTIYIGGGTLTYAELGLISDEARRVRFEDAVEFFCDLAEAVEA